MVCRQGWHRREGSREKRTELVQVAVEGTAVTGHFGAAVLVLPLVYFIGIAANANIYF